MNEMSNVADWVACVNCCQRKAFHAGEKCLYEPTWFDILHCVACDFYCDEWSIESIQGENYALCVKCDARLLTNGLSSDTRSMRKTIMHTYVRARSNR